MSSKALQWLREGPVGQAADKAIEATDSFLGPSGKAWLANGLDELRQAVGHGTPQIQSGNNPGLWGTITTGEATAERLAGSERSLYGSYDVPSFTLDDLRAEANQKTQADERGKEQDRGKDRGDMER